MEKQNTKNIKFDLVKYIKLCFKYWYIFLISIVGLCLLAGAYLYIRKPVKEVDAQLMIPTETSSGGILALADMASSFSLGDMFGASSTENEMMVIKSYAVMKKTAEDLQLNVTYYNKLGFAKWMPSYNKRHLMISTDPSVADTLQTGLLFQLNPKDNGTFDLSVKAKKKKIVVADGISLPYTVKTAYGDFIIAKTEYYGTGEEPIKSYRIKYTSYGAAAEDYTKDVKVFAPNKKADFIAMSYITTDPKFGKLLLSTIISNYNDFGNQKNDDKNNRTLSFVNNRISTLEQELAESETGMEQFKKANKLTDVEIDANVLLQKSSALDASLLQAQTENEILKNTRNFLANPENNYSLIPSLSAGAGDLSASATSASSEITAYNELIMERLRMGSSAKTNNASLKQLNEQIDALRANIISSVDRAYNNSQVKLERIRKENSLTQSRMGSIPTLEKEYIGLERTLILRQQLYLFLLKQREEAQMNLAKTNQSLVTVDEPYTLAETPGMSNFVVLFLAVFFGGILAMFFIYYTKMKKAPISSANDIEDICDAPLLGEIAYAKGADNLELGDNATGENLRMLRSNLMLYEGNTVLVTSATHDEGKSFVASNLAASLALIGKKTLIIDANLRDPKIAEIFGVSASDGLAQILATDSTDTSAIVNVDLQCNASIDVLAAGTINGNPADLLSKETLQQIIRNVKAQYDYVVIDTAQLEDFSDTFALAEAADITLIIARMGLTTPENLVFDQSLFEEKRFKGIAMVANCTKA